MQRSLRVPRPRHGGDCSSRRSSPRLWWLPPGLPAAQAEIELLSATFTPGQPWHETRDVTIQGVQYEDAVWTYVGCQQSVSSRRCSDLLTDHQFTEEGRDYVVRNFFHRIIVDTAGTVVKQDVFAVFAPGLSTRLQTMTLHVGDSTLAFAAAPDM